MKRLKNITGAYRTIERVLKSRKALSLFSAIVAAFLLNLGNINTLNAEDLPWGKTKEPTVITPKKKNPLPGNEDSGRYKNPEPSYQSPRRDRGEYLSRDYDESRQYDRRSAPRDSYQDRRYSEPKRYNDDTYSDSEILDAGHQFFGEVTQGLAKVIERVFADSGRPNGYIVGEEASGAFIAGLKYGEGTLHTKRFGVRKVYWQGPTIGYDFGAQGAKTLVLVYRLRHPRQIYQEYAGVNGSAYFIGGVGLTYQRKDDIVLARIQSGLGVRLGANIGYLKYTRRPTWNPF